MFQGINALKRSCSIARINVLAVALLLLFSDCGSASQKRVNFGNPKQVTLAFYRALAEQDMERAKLTGTEETKKVISILQTFTDAMPSDKQAAERARMQEQLKLLKKAKCEVEDDVAKCTVCCDEAGEFETDFITLRRVDKKWLVDMKKEDLQEE